MAIGVKMNEGLEGKETWAGKTAKY